MAASRFSERDEGPAIAGGDVESITLREALRAGSFEVPDTDAHTPRNYLMSLEAVTKDRFRFLLSAVLTIGPDVDPRKGDGRHNDVPGHGGEDQSDSIQKYARLRANSIDMRFDENFGSQSLEKLIKDIVDSETRALVSSMTLEETFFMGKSLSKRLCHKFQIELLQSGLRIFDASFILGQFPPLYDGPLLRHKGGEDTHLAVQTRPHGDVGEPHRKGEHNRETHQLSGEMVSKISPADMTAWKDEVHRLGSVPAPDDQNDEDMYNVQGNKFAFSLGQLFKLFNPKSLDAFYALGGLGGLEKGLRTDCDAGLDLPSSPRIGQKDMDTLQSDGADCKLPFGESERRLSEEPLKWDPNPGDGPLRSIRNTPGTYHDFPAFVPNSSFTGLKDHVPGRSGGSTQDALKAIFGSGLHYQKHAQGHSSRLFPATVHPPAGHHSSHGHRLPPLLAKLLSGLCVIWGLGVPVALAHNVPDWLLHAVGGMTVAASACIPALQQAQLETDAYKIGAYVAWGVAYVIFMAIELYQRRQDQRRLLLGLVVFCGANLLGSLAQDSSTTIDTIKNWGPMALSLSLWVVPEWIEFMGAGNAADAVARG